ncbi:hypothetical protein [Halorarum salinum]|uniref:Uncharacterized protein n=1 Tax=Halorarum salinum TaxID=2743089 RepID=A0A7D5LAZ4_9EURY|nr:hypothetical protein [Halobaculum salinum]QLG62210.1 hypothetical protein HUG12_10895 [Halobaculum salinum]
MNPISLIPRSGANYELYYIIPVSFVFLFSQRGKGIYLLLAMVALLGAASRHSAGEAMYGPGGEEKRELSDEGVIQRVGTMLHRDKPPHKYSATSSQEMLEEGNLHSKRWGVIVAVLSLFQLLLTPMYIIAVYSLYIHLFEIGFIGAILLFALVALVIYGAMEALWPNASNLNREFPNMDPELHDILENFAFMLDAESISVTGGYYEPSEGGAFQYNCKVEYEFAESVKQDIKCIAVVFCSVVHRSPYPINQADFSLKTSDNTVIHFQIRSLWCRQLMNGEMRYNSFVNRVDRTISIDSKVEKSLDLTSESKMTQRE